MTMRGVQNTCGGGAGHVQRGCGSHAGPREGGAGPRGVASTKHQQEEGVTVPTLNQPFTNVASIRTLNCTYADDLILECTDLSPQSGPYTTLMSSVCT